MTSNEEDLDLEEQVPDEQAVTPEEDTPQEEIEPASKSAPVKPRMVSYEEAQRMAQKRIDKITYERNIERDARARAEQERDEARTILNERSQQHQKANVEALKRERETIRQQLKAAYDTTDYEAVTALQDRLADVAAEMRFADRSEPERPRESAPKKDAPQQSQQEPQQSQQLHPDTQEWLSRNAWVNDKRNRSVYAAAYAITQDLAEEGYDIGPDLYAELDRRLEQDVPRIKQLRNGARTAPAKSGSPVGAPSRGADGAAAGNKANGLTKDDLVSMRKFGMDPMNPSHRKQWLQSRGD